MIHTPWNLTVFTIFPAMFPGPLGHSLAGKALEQGLWHLKTIDIRDHAFDAHGTVDDRPFGGGTGMVMRPDVVGAALEAHHTTGDPLIYLSPRGRVFNQATARKLVQSPRVSFLCGRFEGLDERIIEHYVTEEISLGDFILSGGELGALMIMDACLRLLPRVIQDESALHEESFGEHFPYHYLLEYPHYTRPAVWNGHEVPEILRSGHHQAIADWRLAQAEAITEERRPDLWEAYLEQKKLFGGKRG